MLLCTDGLSNYLPLEKLPELLKSCVRKRQLQPLIDYANKSGRIGQHHRRRAVPAIIRPTLQEDASDMDKYIGKRLDGRYEIRELIGIGGMANVYKAYDVLENRVGGGEDPAGRIPEQRGVHAPLQQRIQGHRPARPPQHRQGVRRQLLRQASSRSSWSISTASP